MKVGTPTYSTLDEWSCSGEAYAWVPTPDVWQVEGVGRGVKVASSNSAVVPGSPSSDTSPYRYQTHH